MHGRPVATPDHFQEDSWNLLFRPEEAVPVPSDSSGSILSLSAPHAQRGLAGRFTVRPARPGAPFESWGRFLPEHTTAVSMLDRLLHHCHVVVTDGESYRMREARNPGGSRPKRS